MKENKNLKDEDFEKAFERSVDRWLEKKYLQFGKWTLGMIGVALFMAILHFILWMDGHQKGERPVQVKAEIRN